MATENKNTAELKPIDLPELVGKFLRFFKRMWIIVLACAILGGCFFAYRAKKSYVPIYEASAFFSVDSGYSESDIFNSNYYDSVAADQLAEAFPYMLSTGIMADLMKDYLGKSSINGSLSAAAIEGTGMFVLRVSSRSPSDAYDILWAAIESYPLVASYMVDDPQIILREEPVMPTKPVFTFSYKAPFMEGALLGAAAAIAVIVLLSLIVNKITSVEQLKRELNRPVISALPLVRIKKRRNTSSDFVMATMDAGLSESFKGMSHKVQKKLTEAGGKTVLVTSTAKNEGKTTVAANLALAMARDGYRVALVDADLRNQSIAQRLSGEQGSVNLLELMHSKAEVMGAFKCVEGTSLYYLSSHSVDGNRYSIDHAGMKRIISELAAEFDYIVIDTPPCSFVADTALLCRYADLVLYVVRADFAARSRIIDAVNSLYDRGGSVAGFIFNGADVKGHRYGYGYGYKYGYGYGYKYGYGSKYGYGRKYGYGEKNSDSDKE